MNLLSINRAATTAFINVAPVTLTLVPRVSVSDGTGGRRKTSGTPRAPQVFTLSEPSDSGFRAPFVTPEGTQLDVDFLLIGEWDAVVDKDDVFTHEGREYKVESVMPDNYYEKRAMVVRHGW